MKLNAQQLEYVITSVREHEAHEAADRLMEHIVALEAELARLTPSGQVAEDVEALVQAIWSLDGRRLQAMNPAQAKDAIAEIVRASRLAAKAQGYELAVADNAALLVHLQRMVAEVGSQETGTDDPAKVPGMAEYLLAAGACEEPHPGAALLERMKKARDDAGRGGDERRHSDISQSIADLSLVLGDE